MSYLFFWKSIINILTLLQKNIYESICRDLLGLIYEISAKNTVENFTVFMENKNVIHKIFKILDNNDKKILRLNL